MIVRILAGVWAAGLVFGLIVIAVSVRVEGSITFIDPRSGRRSAPAPWAQRLMLSAAAVFWPIIVLLWLADMAGVRWDVRGE